MSKIYPWKHAFNCYSSPPPPGQGDLSSKFYSCEDEDVKYVWKMYQPLFILFIIQQRMTAEAFEASSPPLRYNFLSSALLSSTLSIWLRPVSALTVKRELRAACNRWGNLCCETLGHQQAKCLKKNIRTENMVSFFVLLWRMWSINLGSNTQL